MTGRWGRVVTLAVAGGVAFWVANLAISLTPIAAEYREALSIPYVPMLVEAFLGGMLIALGVSIALVRSPADPPVGGPVARALSLSLIALVIVTVVIELPSKLSVDSGDPVGYFLIATAFNAVRILALGLAIGGVNARLGPTPVQQPRPMRGAQGPVGPRR